MGLLRTRPLVAMIVLLSTTLVLGYESEGIPTTPNPAPEEDGLFLNLGCGAKPLEGWVNVDKHIYADGVVQVDLEKFPWPWADNSVSRVLLEHILEHIGNDVNVYFSFMKELYRVCRHNAAIRITVPHPRHDNFIDDPTHVRPITELGLRLFSKYENEYWRQTGGSNTPLGEILDVDFRMDKMEVTASDLFWEEHPNISEEEAPQVLKKASKLYNNMITQTTFYMVAWKEPLPDTLFT